MGTCLLGSTGTQLSWSGSRPRPGSSGSGAICNVHFPGLALLDAAGSSPIASQGLYQPLVVQYVHDLKNLAGAWVLGQWAMEEPITFGSKPKRPLIEKR